MSGYDQIYGNLVRQQKALELLRELLEEEFSLLRENKTDDVVALEFSIHELLRQLADERVAIKMIMQGTKISEYAELLEPERCVEVKALLKKIDDAEQKSARQASHNTRLSLSLLDQSQGLLDFLHDQVAPKPQKSYGGKKAFHARNTMPALLSGRA